MPTGFAPAVAEEMLDAFAGNEPMTALSAHWIQLHTGDPGGAGTANQATEDTRQEVSFAAASGGSVVSNAPVSWTDVAASETYTHFTSWSVAGGGSFQGSGEVSDGAVTAGTTFTVDSGDLEITLNVAG